MSGATDGDVGSVQERYFDDLSYTVRHIVADTRGADFRDAR